MTIIVDSTETVGSGQIGYRNIFNDVGATVTVSTEASGFSKENAFDGFGYDFWKPTVIGESFLQVGFSSTKLVNYAAIWGHNFQDHGAYVKIQYSIDNASSWQDVTTNVKPNTGDTLYFTFDPKLASFWRVLVNNPTTISSIAGIQIGESMPFTKDMEVGFAPPSLAPRITLKTARSESGVFLGGSKLSEGITGNFMFKNMDPVWVRDIWVPFLKHAQTPSPFVLSWNSDIWITEAILAWVKGNVPIPNYSSPLYMDVALNFEGRL